MQTWQKTHAGCEKTFPPVWHQARKSYAVEREYPLSIHYTFTVCMSHSLSSTFSSPFDTASQSEPVLLSVFQFCSACVTHVFLTCSLGKAVNTHDVLVQLQVSPKGLNECIRFLYKSRVCWTRNRRVRGSCSLRKQIHKKRWKVKYVRQ